jgi:hypothetical protein
MHGISASGESKPCGKFQQLSLGKGSCWLMVCSGFSFTSGPPSELREESFHPFTCKKHCVITTSHSGRNWEIARHGLPRYVHSGSHVFFPAASYHRCPPLASFQEYQSQVFPISQIAIQILSGSNNQPRTKSRNTAFNHSTSLASQSQPRTRFHSLLIILISMYPLVSKTIAKVSEI